MKVSILIPTYNRAHYLSAAVGSARAQTHSDLEILILDDASTDETPAVTAAFAAADRRVRCLRHPRNVGIVANWKAGITAAAGDLFCLLHDDDTFEPEFIESLLRPLHDHEDLILAFSDHWVMDAAGTRLVGASETASRRFRRAALAEGRLSDFARSALLDLSVPVGATLFRRSLVRSDWLRPEAKGSIDAWLFYQCVGTGRGAYYVARRLMNYRSHAGGMTARAPLFMTEGHLFRYRNLLADPRLTPLHASIENKLAGALTDYGIALLTAGRHREARRSLLDSLRRRPGRRAAGAFLLACGGAAGSRLVAALRRQRSGAALPASRARASPGREDG